MNGICSESISYRFNLDIEGYQCVMDAVVPKQEINLLEFLPMIWKLQDALIQIWIQINAAEGKAVSCKMGCGTCCRQLVPVSEIEALHLGKVVDGLSEGVRGRVLGRFAYAMERMSDKGLLDALGDLAALDLDEKRQLGHAYFSEMIPCPFLEEESCSIHSMRPSACREYLVTSPAVNCSFPNAKGIDILRHSAKFSNILFSFADGTGHAAPRIIPLILALSPQQAGSASPFEQRFYAPTLFENFMNRLAVLFAQIA